MNKYDRIINVIFLVSALLAVAFALQAARGQSQDAESYILRCEVAEMYDCIDDCEEEGNARTWCALRCTEGDYTQAHRALCVERWRSNGHPDYR